jgi:hypothetical protein
LFVLGGVSAALHREVLSFDLSSRRYSWRRGRVGAVEKGGGGFEDVEAVVLVKDLERRGSDKVDEWEVELVLRGLARPVEVLETKDEQTARREAERLADRLGAEFRERTSTRRYAISIARASAAARTAGVSNRRGSGSPKTRSPAASRSLKSAVVCHSPKKADHQCRPFAGVSRWRRVAIARVTSRSRYAR